MSEKIIGIDLEWNKDTIALCFAIHDGQRSYLYTTKEEMWEAIQRYKDYTFIAHNSKSDCLCILTTFGYLHRNWYCTMIADQNINKGLGKKIKGGVLTKSMVGGVILQKRPWSLYGNLERYLGIKPKIDKEELQMSFLEMNPGDELSQAQKDYALSDVEYLLPLREAQLVHLRERGLENKVELVNFPCIPIFTKKEFKKVKINEAQHRINILGWKQQKENLETSLYNMLTAHLSEVPEVNFASVKQLKQLYEAMSWPLPKGDTVSGFSFADGALEMYLSFPLPDECRRFTEIYRELVGINKLLSTYGESFLSNVRDGRMGSTYSISFTDTDRVTSSNVNLNNIPKIQAIRGIFVPDDGYVFVDSDHAGQETLIAAEMSQEPLLIKAVRDGFDMHSYLASEAFSIIFNRRVEIVNEDKIIEIDGIKYNSKKDLRQIQKNVTFTKFYGGGYTKILLYLGRYIRAHNPPEQADAIAKTVDKKLTNLLPVLNKYLQAQVEFAKENGYNIANILGGKRYYENPKSVFGDSMNYSVQATGADAIKIAEIKIDRAIRNKTIELGLRPDTLDEFQVGWIAMQVYDQVVVCVRQEYAEEFKEIVDKAMTDALQIFLKTLTASSDTKVVSSWS